ncbi:MAG: thioesterase, partial [Myxococcales bacterium]|nr:thioesterase [Myxococcales bacterium]
DAVLPALSGLGGKPFALFGHSLGALMAYELTRRLRDRGGPMPGHLFLSGRRAPHVAALTPNLHHLPPSTFLAEVRKLGGTPNEVWEYPELVEMMRPALQADFQMSETWPKVTAPTAEHVIDVPMTVLGGTADPMADAPSLEAWQAYARGGFKLQLMPGDHFYLQPQRDAVLRTIAERWPA